MGWSITDIFMSRQSLLNLILPENSVFTTLATASFTDGIYTSVRKLVQFSRI